MKQLIDFLPLLLFFVGYKFGDIYIATGILMLATMLQMVYFYSVDGRLSAIHKTSLVLILVFGALTLWLQDERFIKWKPTILYAAIGLAMLVAWWGFHKNAVQALLGKHLQLSGLVWGRLNLAWMLYAFFMATLNAYVVQHYSTEEWVEFKLWGYIFPLVFLLGQGLYLARYLKDDEAKQ